MWKDKLRRFKILSKINSSVRMWTFQFDSCSTSMRVTMTTISFHEDKIPNWTPKISIGDSFGICAMKVAWWCRIWIFLIKTGRKVIFEKGSLLLRIWTQEKPNSILRTMKFNNPTGTSSIRDNTCKDMEHIQSNLILRPNA